MQTEDTTNHAFGGTRPRETGLPTVLIVEDNDVVSDFLDSALRAYGYRVLLAATPDQAVEHCLHESNAICALIADVRLGGRDGFKTAHMLMPIHPEMKVIFTSGYPLEHLVREGSLPASIEKKMFLQKPFLPTEIKSLLNFLSHSAQADTQVKRALGGD